MLMQGFEFLAFVLGFWPCTTLPVFFSPLFHNFLLKKLCSASSNLRIVGIFVDLCPSKKIACFWQRIA